MRLSRWRQLRFGLARKGLLPRGVIVRDGIKHEVFYAEGEMILSMGFDLLWFLVPYIPTMEVPYLITLWDLQHRINPFFPEVSAGGIWGAREKGYSETLRRAMGIVTGTAQGGGDAERFYQIPEERIFVNPYPSPDIEQPLSRSALDGIMKKHGLSAPFLFYPAQLWAHKNHVRLFEGVRLLKTEWNLSFQVVLSGAAKCNVRHLMDMAGHFGIAEQIRNLGFVSHEDMGGLYQNAFALVFPTLCGPDNLPPLEAFSSGCPVVASDIPGAREQLGDAALFFDPLNPRELAKAVATLRGSEALRGELIARGYAIAKNRTVEQYLRNIYEILDGVSGVRCCWGN